MVFQEPSQEFGGLRVSGPPRTKVRGTSVSRGHCDTAVGTLLSPAVLTRDGPEDAGDVYYMPAGHTGVADKDTK